LGCKRALEVLARESSWKLTEAIFEGAEAAVISYPIDPTVQNKQDCP
jgi:hypothetical protein